MTRDRIRAGRWLAAVVVGLVSSGCSTLLPSSKRELVSDWDSYDRAVKSLATIEPYKAMRSP